MDFWTFNLIFMIKQIKEIKISFLTNHFTNILSIGTFYDRYLILLFNKIDAFYASIFAII